MSMFTDTEYVYGRTSYTRGIIGIGNTSVMGLALALATGVDRLGTRPQPILKSYPVSKGGLQGRASRS